jgi:site-specific DNA-cytosine methylase
LKLDKIKSVDELTDEDFLHPTRNVELPSLPKKIADTIGTEGKPVVIKKNIFERNYMRHKDVTPELSKVIFKSALYNPDLYGQNQKKSRPYNWVLINTKDEKGNNRTVLLEVNPNKDNVEIVHWHFVNDKNLGLIKKQAIREGDQVLILPSEQSEEVGGLSNLTDDLSAAKIDNSSETTKENGEKVDVEEPKTFEEFLNHPSLKFSIKNEEQRKAAENAYEYASKLRPNKSSKYALVDMSNPSNSPQYYEKKVLADRWRRFYNKVVHNELDDVYKDAWGNYKLFDLDRPFADQVNEVKGDVPSEFNAPDVVANKNADNESGAEYHEYKQDEPSSITYKDRYKAFKQREANREKTAGLRKERKEVEDVYKSKSEERVEYNKQLMKEYMDEHGLSSENDIPYDVWDNLRSKSFEKYQDELDSLFNKYKDLDKQIKAVAEPRFSLKDEKIKSVAEKFGVNEDDVAMYANAVEKGSTAEAARARANIKRYLLQANEDKISSFKELMKYTVPVNESLKENFGDLDAMIEEQRKQVEAERNAMEAARKRAQEEEEKRQKHLDELSLIPTDELDKRYMDAIANNDESTAREMLDESARRKGYGDVDSDYQGQGAWAAPSNPQYESDEARRADIENSPDVNLEDIALGYSLQPDDYFDNPRAYMNNTAYGLESAHVIKNALDAIKNGEKDVKVKVYRAVPTSVKEGKLRNGDWVTPSKKYAEMHGDNRLEGKYRIIEDEVPANQLWWDGNDANEFGFDDGKEYRYKNAKNNRKLNDLITYDNKGNVIPPSKRFNSRKNDIRFSLAGERGAADMAEDLKSLNTPDEVDDAIKTAIEDMPSGWKMANKKMIHIAQALGENRKAEIAGEEPKFSLKDGTLIKAGTYFSGGGLVEEGLKGIIDPVVAVEYDEKISGVYRNNFGQHIVTADVRDVDPKELVKQIDGEVEYFHASPVCKNYSQAKSNHAEVELDKETAASTAEFINAIKPKVVTIENVKGYKDSDAMKTITDALDANGYTWDADVYNAADYGGYTNRERLIVRAVRDGKLPEKPKKMAHKSGWYEAVADIIPTLTEKKNGVAPWMDIRLKADGIDWRNIDKPLYVMGSAYADGKIPHAFADELLPTLRTKSGDVIVMPDGKVYRAMGRVLARVSGVSDDYKMPFSENLSHTIIGNGIPTQLTEHVIAPLLTGSDPKFSIRTYHGTGASFDKFDFSHMGEGEGSQAFGWGGYVTNSKDIAEDYTRRAKIRKDNGGFEFVTDMSANNKDMVRQYIYKHKDVNKGLDAMRKDLSSALEMFPDDDDLKELSNILAKNNEEIAVPDNIAYLYDVDIPDDNGDYLDWDAPLTDKQKNTIIKELRRLKIDFADFKKRGFSFDGSFGGNAYDFLMYALRKTKKWKDVNASRAVSKFLSSIGFTGIKYKAGTIFGGAKEDDYNYVIFDENNANIVGNTRFSLRYDQFEHDLNQWKKDNNLPKDAQRPTIPQRNAGESAVDFLRRVDEYRKQMALWKTAPTYEQHLLSDDTALGEFNRELQRGSVLKRIAFQDSMLAIRKAQEAIMKEVGVDRLNMAEDAYTAENRSHGKGKNEFEEYNNEFLQPLRKAYHQMKKVLGDSYDNVRIYMMAKHGLERDAQMAFKKSLEADYEDVAQRSAAYKAYKGDMNRIINDSDLEFGRVDFTTWRQRDNALRVKYSPSYMDYRYDKNGIAYDYSGLSALFDGSDFEEAAHKLISEIESKYVAETKNLWDATNAATKKILRDGYKAGMMSKDTYQYVRDMYSHYIPLRGWDGTTADQVWDYIGGGKGAFNQTLKTAHGRTSIADDPIAYIENMAESGILLNNKNWVKQHLMLLAQNHPTSLLTLSKAWYVKSTDANGNEEWIPATPQISSQMNSNQVKAAIDAFEKKMEQMAQAGDATQKRDGLNIAYPQTHSEEREHEVRVMKDGEEYVIYVNGDPQLAQAMNNTRAHRVSEGIKNSISKRVIAVVGRKMAAAYTSLSPLFIPSNYFRDLTMTLASTAIREDAKYNYLLRKNLATSWNLGFMLRDFQNGKLRDKVNNGNATPKEQMFYDFMMNGGETGFVSSLDVEDLKKKFKNDLKDLDRWKANPVKVGHTIMDSIEFLNRMIEDSNRFAVYMTSIQYGRSIDEAVNDAKDVTLNFNRKGTGEHSWQTIRNLYLFINPAVQSLQTLGALAKHHPFKFTAVTASWLASGVLVPIVNVALMQLVAAFLGGDGDDDKDWYKDISKKYWQFSKWDRRNNFIMWVPTTHEFVKIPLAQEFRAFYGLGDMIASKMMGGELAEESWEDYGWDLVGQVVDMLPLDPTGYDGNIAVSLMPNAIRPVFELAFNVDFTGKPLFKDTEYNKYDPNFTKAYVGTPDWLVRASRMMNSIGNDYPNVQQNKWDALGNPRYNLNNPAVVDHVLSSYLGGAYTMGSQVLGLLTKSLNDRKEIKVADIPLFSKFVSNPDDRPVTKKQGDEFWNMKENHDRAANTLSKLKKQAKVDGDYSMLERFYGSEEYKKYKQDDVKVKKYEEDKKKERAEDSGEEYRPHKLNAEDIYKAHATPKDDFEDLKLKQLYTKLNGFKTSYDLLVDTAPSQSDGYYNNNKAAIDAIDEISLDKQEISELKKGFLDDGKDAYNAEDMKQIRDLRKKILSVLEKANKVVVANQKAKAKK